MKQIHVMIVGCMAVVISGCNLSLLLDIENGSGVSASEDREVGDFTTIKLSGAGTLDIVCGQPASLNVTTDDNLLEFIETQVSNDTLMIRNTKNLNATVGPIHDIGTETVQRVSVSGSGKINVADFDGENLEFDISGSGQIKVVGVTHSVSVDVSGSGSADLTELVSQTADIRISGSGKAKVNASEQLNVSISGSGRVDYIGNPKVKKRIAGSGRISKMKSSRTASMKKKSATDSEEISKTDSEESKDEDEESD